MPEFDILTLADLNVDLVLANADPEFGQKEKMISGYLLELGGSCPIFACQAAKLKLRTAVAGVMGDDLFGHFMQSRLTECGVDVSLIEMRKGFRTAASFALCRENDRAILTDEAGITAMPYQRVTAGFLAKARHIHVGSYFLLANLRPHFAEILKMARSQGLTVSVDTNWDPAEKWEGVSEILELTDVFMPNENELMAISGIADLDRALEKMSEIVPLVVVKRGSLGAIARQGDKIWRVPVFPIQYVDGVGAGDSFDAGFLKGYLNDWPVEKCLRLASYCGAMNTTAQGGINGQPHWEDLPQELFQK
ncbi:MAG TPA: carbohydrate kinase [Firmicutes bacterium]|jgi:ribokinase|nr:carbohydrate kinase [Bacillota bacterium]